MKEDYYLTPDKLWIPLRWIAPELLEEYRGSLIVTDQTKTSNVWYVLKPAQMFLYTGLLNINKSGWLWPDLLMWVMLVYLMSV